MRGLGLQLDEPLLMYYGERVRVSLTADDGEHEFPVEVATAQGAHLGLTLEELSIGEQRAYVRCTFGSPEAWENWDRDIREDKPLASFVEVFSFGATGYVRLLQSAYNKVLSWLRPRAPAAPAR
jgi:cellulose synthase (UDP-forming)